MPPTEAVVLAQVLQSIQAMQVVPLDGSMGLSRSGCFMAGGAAWRFCRDAAAGAIHWAGGVMMSVAPTEIAHCFGG